MIKVSLFQGSEEFGPPAISLFGPSDSYFEKVASATLLPEVSQYIASLRPENDSQYVLVNAMGAGEYYGSNVNGDRFKEAALIHKPNSWRGIPSVDRILAKDWAYGFPTFYGAHVYPHHRNQDSSRALGTVELAAWNPHMKRVELVTKLKQQACARFGGQAVWDKLKANGFPDLSMGCRVPFDTCSVCTDLELYQKAIDTFDPKRHKSPGAAVLAYHRKLIASRGHGIRGVSITRADYCEHTRRRMNFILPDGRKVWVDNDWPSFFDISFVFIGADKIAKALMKIADSGRVYSFMGSAELAEKLSSPQMSLEKLAEDASKSAEFNKEVVPNQLAGKAVPLLTRNEPDLPPEVLTLLSRVGQAAALATLSGLGIVLRPREFQRMSLTSSGDPLLASLLDSAGLTFTQSGETTEVPLREEDFSPTLASILAPHMADRSAFGPIVERRVLILAGSTPSSPRPSASHPTELLRKIGAAYNGYRAAIMQFVPCAQDLIDAPALNGDLRKLSAMRAEELFTPLSFQYLSNAFLDELSKEAAQVSSAQAGVQRANPLVTTRSIV